MSSATPQSTIATIPAELLLKIFYAFVEPRQGAGHYRTIDSDQGTWHTGVGRAVVLTHVCSEWRALSLGEPPLWTDIRVAVDFTMRDFLYFRRSDPLPIDLTVNLGSRGPTKQEMNARRFRKMLAEEMMENDFSDRLRSLRIIHFDYPRADDQISDFSELKLSKLSSLFIRTINPSPPENSRYTLDLQSQLSPLLRETLTSLEIHSHVQNLDDDFVTDCLRLCPQLATLVLGGLLLSDDSLPNLLYGIAEKSPPILAPALRRLAVGSPMFKDSQRCKPGCSCPFQNIVANALEYLEVAGDSISDTLHHLCPLLQRQGNEDSSTSSSRGPLTLVINSHSAASSFDDSDDEFMLSLPLDVHLHLLNDESGRGSEHYEEAIFPQWFKAVQSTVLYFPNDNCTSGSVSWEWPTLNTFRRLRPRRGVIPVVIHPTAKDCLELGDEEMVARGWVLSGKADQGPYMDAYQPIADLDGQELYSDSDLDTGDEGDYGFDGGWDWDGRSEDDSDPDRPPYMSGWRWNRGLGSPGE